jgi:hypothetical protein
MGEAGDQSTPNRVDDAEHDNRDSARGLLDRSDLSGTIGHHEVRLKTHEFRRETQGPVILVLRPSALKDEVLALDIPTLSQTGYD